MPGAPHEVLMILDSGTGQNALSQLQHFDQAVDVTGLCLTKLDGTAKGGILLAIASRTGLPVRFIGIGESIEDLRIFDAEEFVDALLPDSGDR
jgi:fused signal recognition particle receptor